jgi:hypothetical protein
MGLEWTTLKFIEDSPIIVRAATFIVALAILAVIESRDWLNFKRKGAFRNSIILLVLLYVGICAYAFFYLENHEPPKNPVISNLQSQLSSLTRERDAARQERDAAVRALQGRDANKTSQPPTSQTPNPAENLNDYPPLTRERERALVQELADARDILGQVPILRAGAHNEAFGYRNSLLPLFDRAQVPVTAGDEATGGIDQTGVMVALMDLNNPSKAAEKILEILTSTGFRPKVIQAKPGHGDYYIFIGPRPL